jgi:hypothetical protein
MEVDSTDQCDSPALVHESLRKWANCSDLGGPFGPIGHILSMNSRVHPKYKTKYRVSNWAEYDRALVQRGDITISSHRRPRR